MSTKTITVKSVSDNHRVLIWEVNDLHPNGEAFISNNQKPVVVGETPAIARLLSEGAIEKTTTKSK